MTEFVMQDAPLPAVGDPEQNVYSVMQLQPGASPEEVKRKFREQALKTHPDKTFNGDSGNFTQLAQAYNVLDDPIRRALNDMKLGVIPDTPNTHLRIHKLKQQQAEKEQALMEEEVARIRKLEREQDGLIILEAKYGLLDPDPCFPNGPFVDVTVPVQCLVSDSKLMLDAQSKLWLEGFYDPTHGQSDQDLEMYIRYEFLGGLHEVVYNDVDEVRIPVREHLVDPATLPTCGGALDEASVLGAPPNCSEPSFTKAATTLNGGGKKIVRHRPQGPSFEQICRQQLVQQQKDKRRRRYFAVGALSMILAGGYVYAFHREEAQQQVQKSVTRIAQWLLDLVSPAKPSAEKANRKSTG